MRLPFLNTHIVSVIGTMFDCLQRLHLDLVLSNVKHNTAEPICFDQLLKFVFAIERERELSWNNEHNVHVSSE